HRDGVRRDRARRGGHAARRRDPGAGQGRARRPHPVPSVASEEGVTMAHVPKELRYTRDHEWARREGDRVRVGITAYAQEQLGDVVFVELPKVGVTATAKKPFGVVESVKAVSDLFAPVSGQVGHRLDRLDDAERRS